MPCADCTNPTLCTERCQAYAEQLKACEASGQVDSRQVSAHVEAGEMPKPGPGEADCSMCKGRGVWGIPGARCSFCKGTGRVKFWRPCDDAAPKGEAGEMEAAKGDDK